MYFVPMPPRTHPDGRGGVSNRAAGEYIGKRSRVFPTAEGTLHFLSWGIFMCGIAGFCDFNAEKLKQDLLRRLS